MNGGNHTKLPGLNMPSSNNVGDITADEGYCSTMKEGHHASDSRDFWIFASKKEHRIGINIFCLRHANAISKVR